MIIIIITIIIIVIVITIVIFITSHFEARSCGPLAGTNFDGMKIQVGQAMYGAT